jgi:hypothetical protein
VDIAGLGNRISHDDRRFFGSLVQVWDVSENEARLLVTMKTPPQPYRTWKMALLWPPARQVSKVKARNSTLTHFWKSPSLIRFFFWLP